MRSLREREFGHLVTISAGRRVPLSSGIIIPHNNSTHQPPYCTEPNQIAVASAAPLHTAQYHYMDYIESNHTDTIQIFLSIVYLVFPSRSCTLGHDRHGRDKFYGCQRVSALPTITRVWKDNSQCTAALSCSAQDWLSDISQGSRLSLLPSA